MPLSRMQARATEIVADEAIAARISAMPVAQEIAQSYIAGQTLEAAVLTARDKVEVGLDIALHPLATRARDAAAADAAMGEALDAVAALGGVAELAGHAEVSLELSTLGLGFDPAGAGDRAARICRLARNAGVEVTIDDEGPQIHDRVLDVVHDLLADFPDTGVVVQAARHDSLEQIQELAVPGRRIRLCKGSYTGPSEVTLIRPHDVDLRMAACLRALVTGPATPLVATHDPVFVAITERLIEDLGRTDVEFQMLQGIRDLEQRRLVDVGHRMRVYLPYGTDWYRYCARRVIERPANVWLFARSMVGQR